MGLSEGSRGPDEAGGSTPVLTAKVPIQGLTKGGLDFLTLLFLTLLWYMQYAAELSPGVAIAFNSWEMETRQWRGKLAGDARPVHGGKR
jgi:hypothetical protein